MEKIDNKGILVMDVCLIPRDIDVERWYTLYKEYNIIFWDSFNKPIGAQPPYWIDCEPDETYFIIDTSTEEGKKRLKELQERNKDV